MPSSRQQIRLCTSRDGARIAFAISGDGPPLLFAQHWIHHLEHDWDSPIWRPWLELLSQRHTVIRFDWRGCGLSDRVGVEFSADRYLDDFASVIEAAQLGRFALFGMAQGARIGIAYTATHPERISRLVLYQPSTSG